MRLNVLTAVTLLAVASLPGPANAACTLERQRWILVDVNLSDWDKGLTREFLGQVGTSFDEMGLTSCSPGEHPGEPLVRVTVGSGAVAGEVAITVKDRVTAKTVSRSLDLSGYGGSARALALAVALEELVRSSWAELALDSPRRQQQLVRTAPPPPEVRRVATERLPPSPRTLLSLRLEGAADYSGAGQPHAGGRLSLGIPIGDAFTLRFGVGMEAGVPARSARSEVDSRWLHGLLGVHALLASAGPLDLSFGLQVRSGWVSVSGNPRGPGWVGLHGDGALLCGEGLLAGRLWLSPDWGLVLGLQGGYYGLGVRALDAERVVGGLGGPGVGSGLGLEWRLP